MGPAVLTYALSFLVYDYFFTIPEHHIWPVATNMNDWAALISLSIGSFVGGVAALFLRRSNRRIQHLVDQVRRSNERFKNTLESISDAFFTLDHNDRFIYVNDEAQRLLKKSEEVLIGKSVWDEFPQVEGTIFADMYRKVKSERKPEEFEGLYPPPINGWIEVRSYPSPDGVSVYFHDISERKRAQDERERLMEQVDQERQLAEILAADAQRSAQELNTIFSAMADAVIVYDERGNIIRANDAAAQAYGFDPVNVDRADIIRRVSLRSKDGNLIRPDDLPSTTALHGDSAIHQIFFYTDANEQTITVLVSASPIKEDGRVVGAVAIWHDITELKRTEAELSKARDSAEQTLATLQAVMDTVPIGLIVARPDGSISLTNRAAAEILGGSITRTPEGLRPAAQYNLLYSDGTPICTDDTPLTRSLRDGELTYNVEEIVQRQDGKISILENSAPIRDPHGRIVAAVATITDITEIVKLRDLLEHQVSLLQRALLPRMESIDIGYGIATAYIPGFTGLEIGGDFYDVFKTEDGEVGILIGDVSGKGIEAASIASASRSTAHAFAYDLSSAGKALTHTNCVMIAQQPSEFGFFVTVFLAVLNPATGEIRYSNAGHPPPAICRTNGDVEFLTFGHLPIGLMSDEVYSEDRSFLNPGDKIVFYTDGISEARHGTQMFGQERIEGVLKEFHQLGADELVQKLLDTAKDWAEGRLTDDVAIVIVERSVV